MGPRRASASRPSGRRGHRVGPDDDRVGDRHDLVDRQHGGGGVGADRLGAVGLVDAERTQLAALLGDDVAADPAHARVGLVALDGRAAGRLGEVVGGSPAVAADDDVELHCVTPSGPSLGPSFGSEANLCAPRPLVIGRIAVVRVTACRIDRITLPPMTARGALVGRREERARLEAALERAGAGAGSIVLVGGEAGVGKTRLAAELAGGSDALLLRGAPAQGGSAPYGPVIAALRSHLRSHPHALADPGPLRSQLALLLPELGDPAPAADRPTLFEALRWALAGIAAERHALIVLDDLQWSDEATLELLSALGDPLRELPVLVVAAYRSDGLARDHGIRRLRNELRRAGRLEEIALRPLDLQETADLLAQALGEPAAPALTRAIHDRTEGIPFFVEEL